MPSSYVKQTFILLNWDDILQNAQLGILFGNGLLKEF